MLRASVPIRLVAWLAVTVVIGLVAYLVARQHGSTLTVTGPGIAYATQTGGTAYVGAGEPLDKQPFGFAYFLPADVTWSDASGSLHEGGRPACLPLDKAARVKNIEAVQFTIPKGATTGTVVWVQC